MDPSVSQRIPALCAPVNIRGVRARAVNVPMLRPLQTAGGLVSTAPLVLVDLDISGDIVGSAYVFCYTAAALKPVAQLISALEDSVRGKPLAPFAVERELQKRFRLIGPQGLTGIALAGIEMAAWDALGKHAGLPLCRLLGGEPRPVPAYNSCGLGLIGPERAPQETRELLGGFADGGFTAVKLRLGYSDLETDLAVVRAVRDAAGSHVNLMTDYNQCLSVPEAIRRGRALDGEGLAWIEEPVSADDFAGHAAVARETRTPIQTGENWWGPHDLWKAIAAGASDFVMVDAMKIGGISGWLRAAALAEAAGLPLSSHLFPEISAHLLAVTPTAHWLEYVDFAAPILREPLKVQGGHVTPPDLPGIGLQWNEAAVDKYSYR